MKPSRFEIDIDINHPLLTFTNEEIRIAKRQHWLVLLTPLASAVFVWLFFVALSYLLFLWVLSEIPLFLISSLTVTALCSSVITKSVINWYFHVYIVTDRKLLEIDYKPFFAEGISEIMLDLVRCTEIDIHTDGIINQLFNKGDVYITFDRPTHEEGFVLKNIKSPRHTGSALSELLIPQSVISKKSKSTWLKLKDESKRFQYIEDLLPQKG